MTKAIITMVNVTVNEYEPVQIVMELFLYNSIHSCQETLYLDITEKVVCELADILSEYNNQYILSFDTTQHLHCVIHWVSSDIICFGIGSRQGHGLEYKEYRLSSTCAAELSAAINSFMCRSSSRDRVFPLRNDTPVSDVDSKLKQMRDDNLRSIFT